ncbi:cell division protein SepF [Spirulina sp. CS-785/01]|uniref:cell division protein SepF n=1 Tax=Spirulina sp. CS-785/01 TaxID=3021716 RepID=UPI00232DB05F|nr:cell division protein SepF [Spirulina sp. CS-785/01]MDB9314385.1 cell division protein SepF [Spirulina sp. CS-785/01]
MNKIFTKLRDIVAFNEGDEYEYYEEDMEGNDYQNLYQQENPPAPVEEERQPPRRNRERPNITATETGMASASATSRSNVIGMPGSANGVSEVVVIEPRSFEEMPQVIQALRERKSVVLNLTVIDPDEAQRAVDFVAGGTYAIDGHQERIGESIFLFTPSCVQVSTHSGMAQEVAGAAGTTPLNAVRPPSAPASPAWTVDPNRLAQ